MHEDLGKARRSRKGGTACIAARGDNGGGWVRNCEEREAWAWPAFLHAVSTKGKECQRKGWQVVGGPCGVGTLGPAGPVEREPYGCVRAERMRMVQAGFEKKDLLGV